MAVKPSRPPAVPPAVPQDDTPAGALASVGRYLAIGVTLPAATFTGYLIGYGLDRLFGTHFLGIVFLLLGTAGGLTQVVRMLTR